MNMWLFILCAYGIRLRIIMRRYSFEVNNKVFLIVYDILRRYSFVRSHEWKVYMDTFEYRTCFEMCIVSSYVRRYEGSLFYSELKRSEQLAQNSFKQVSRRSNDPRPPPRHSRVRQEDAARCFRRYESISAGRVHGWSNCRDDVYLILMFPFRRWM